MSSGHLALLVFVFFVTSGVSVITGSTSAITVPVMFQFGVDPRVAVATNMFALTFMSMGGTLPFIQSNVMYARRLPALIILTLLGSAIGACLLVIVPTRVIPAFVSAAILALAVFSMVYRQSGVEAAPGLPSRNREIAGYALTFVLGIYGGLFSGGYVTILTAIFVAVFRMTFLQAIATTKLINIFSSGVATVIFMGNGLVDYRLGTILGGTMFFGALLGARFARRLGDLWLRRIYLTAVWLLGLKTLLFDVLKPGWVRPPVVGGPPVFTPD